MTSELFPVARLARRGAPPDAIPPSAPLSPGAALAAAAEPAGERRRIEFAALEARTILTRCASRRMPFAWTLNPYRGCEFGCQYCYARYAHEFLELRGNLDFERKIFVKRRAADLLRRDLPRVKPGEGIAIGTATDPYQPAEREFEATRSVLEVLAAASGLEFGLVTKSALVARDADLLARAAERNHVTVRITVTTVNADLARRLEPRAPRPDLRLAALRRLRAAGVHAGVICAPLLPGLTDSPAALDALAAAAAAAGAEFLHGGVVYLGAAARAHFLPFLRQRFPVLAGRYEKAFAASAYLPPAAQEAARAAIAAAAARHGLPSRAAAPPRRPPPAPSPSQLRLF